MTSNYDLIIFDCDGTLVDSEAICNAVLVDLVNEFINQKYTMQHALENWAGNTLSKVLQVVEKEKGCKLPKDLGLRYVDECNKKLKSDLKVVSGALGLVKRCDMATAICVGSNGERTNVLDSLKLCGFLPDFFKEDNIFTRIQVSNGKPAPDLFLMAADKMGVAPLKCLVIEDSPTGVQAGVAAGMEVWGFTGVSHDPELQAKMLKNAGARAVFNQLIHIQERLGY